MEDQQPHTGDLTAEDAAAASGAAPEAAPKQHRRGIFRRRRDLDAAGKSAVVPTETDDPVPRDKPKTPVGKGARGPRTVVKQQDSGSAAVGGPAKDAGTEPSEVGEAPAEQVTRVAHRPAGKRLMVAAVAASVLFVGGGAFAGAMAQPYLAERALVETKLDIARTAAKAITTLWTYTPDDMGTLAARASRYLGGDFAEEYRRYIDAIVEPNKQAQVTNTTEVKGAAVESVASPGVSSGPPPEATALVYTNSVATSPVTKNIPSLRYLSYRLTLQRDGSEWLITRMTTVTSFDLTPQL
ncbi:mammalian cell entry protein [Mycolicibacterium hippocampi]|uniref:mammalian cell entry protein n=1 Tax=Mycolicibacterium hippocampi TaxID=659824 RepID=UPI0035143100